MLKMHSDAQFFKLRGGEAAAPKIYPFLLTLDTRTLDLRTAFLPVP
jgi:hypothetical protein